MAQLASFKHRNLALIEYGELDEAAGPTPNENQLVSDWHRYATDVENNPYHINGQNMSELVNGPNVRHTPLLQRQGFLPKSRAESPTKELLAIETPEEKAVRVELSNQAERDRLEEGRQNLAEFFEAHLFGQVSDPEQRHTLVQMAMKHFHQGGLPHATNLAINKKNPTDCLISDPKRKINFTWTPEGLLITEENRYKEWADKKTGAKHRCPDDSYFAETKSTYLLTPDAKLQLIDLEIDCPDADLAPAFDKRPPSEQPTRSFGISKFLETHLHWKRAILDGRPPESRTLYEMPLQTPGS